MRPTGKRTRTINTRRYHTSLLQTNTDSTSRARVATTIRLLFGCDITTPPVWVASLSAGVHVRYHSVKRPRKEIPTIIAAFVLVAAREYNLTLA